jgi:hypothetical protein
MDGYGLWFTVTDWIYLHCRWVWIVLGWGHHGALYTHSVSPFFFSLFLLYKDFLGLGVVEVLKNFSLCFWTRFLFTTSCLVSSCLVSSRLVLAALVWKEK